MTAQVEGTVVLICLAAALGGCRRDAPAAASAPPAKVEGAVKEADLATVTLTPEAEKRLGITVEPLVARSLPPTRVIAGQAMVPPGLTIDVAAPVAGTVIAAGATPAPGQAVKRGQPIFRVVPLLPADRDLRINAQKDLDSALAALELARKKAARAEQLLADGTGSRRSLEEARAELANAEAAHRAAAERAALVSRSRMNEANELVVAAPIDGIVEALHVAPGQTVAASAPLLQVSRVDRLWIRVPLYAGDRDAIDPSQGADVLRLADPPDARGLRARHVQAPPTADPAASAVDLMFELPGRAIRPGERVLVRLVGRGAESALAVAESALLTDVHGNVWVYARVADHKYARRRVEVARLAGGVAALTRAPAPGTPIVTTGAAELYGIEFGAGK
jgi:RND family efflux transporter MFP subunit